MGAADQGKVHSLYIVSLSALKGWAVLIGANWIGRAEETFYGPEDSRPTYTHTLLFLQGKVTIQLILKVIIVK